MTYRLSQKANGGPVLQAERLRLPRLSDVEPSYRFWSSDRSNVMGGAWSMETVHAETRGRLDQWQKHGFSLLNVTRRGSDHGIGPFFPDTHPKSRLGWSLSDAADDGQGLAQKAATAARDWFLATSGSETSVSYTGPKNHRSHRLCQRPGAAVDPDAPHPCGVEPTLTFRHHAPGAA